MSGDRRSIEPDLIVRSLDPFNAETPAAILCESDITATPRFYIRSHGETPAVDAGAFHLTISGPIARDVRLSLQEVKRLPRHSVIATLQCAGNRRGEFARIAELNERIAWGAGAIGNARWTGTRLRDVLEGVGVKAAGHVAFLGLDRCTTESGSTRFGASIPLAKALEPEVLLAYEMNGQPLTPEHGWPLRLIVPGYIAARSVKWLAEIRVQNESSSNYFQSVDYRFAPPLESAIAPAYPLSDATLNAAICKPTDGSVVSVGDVQLRGYAIAGGSRRIGAVGIAINGSQSYRPARIVSDHGPWGWAIWEATVSLPRGRSEVTARAWDSSGATQPEELGALVNELGYANGSVHRVVIHAH